MQIRLMVREDFQQITALGMEFAKESKLIPWNSTGIDPQHVSRVLYSAMTNGLCLVALEENGIINGMLLSIKDRDTWIPSIIRLKEMAWWVKPEFRKTSLGIQLLDDYISRAEQLRLRGEIMTYSIGHYVYSPKIAEQLIQARGFKFLETNYVIGEY